MKSLRSAWKVAACGVLALLASRSAAQEPSAPRSALARPVVIGASVSSGFGLARGLDAALEASLVLEHEPVRAWASELFFMQPLQMGPSQVEQALDAEPSAVIAIDFLFWFGYGASNVAGAPITSEDERLALLERGLACLEEIECPLVVGDFPDMSLAVGKMLAPAQMPALETLPRLSARVRAWAAERENTIVVPLFELVQRLRSKEAVRIGRHAWPAGTRLLQPDDLHPTLEGMAGIAQLVADELVQRGLAREADVSFDLPALLAKLRPERAAAK